MLRNYRLFNRLIEKDGLPPSEGNDFENALGLSGCLHFIREVL